MDIENVLVLGDSISAAREADTGLDLGWPLYLNVPASNRQAISGSRADQWASDFRGKLTKAKNTKADTVILSLLGNDMFEAMKDGKVTWQEKFLAFTSMQKVLRGIGERERIIVLQYANPILDPLDKRFETAKQVLPLLNSGIALCCAGVLNVELVDLGECLSDNLNDGHFDGRDIHPTAKGHKVIAEWMAEL